MKAVQYRKKKLARKLYRHSRAKSSLTNACTLNNQPQFAESYLELVYQKKLELDKESTLLESQPFTLIYQRNDRPGFDYTFTPDILTTSVSEQECLHEVKCSARLTEEMEERHQFFKDALAEDGIDFKVVTERDIGNWLVMSNIMLLSGYLKCVHTEQEIVQLVSMLPLASSYKHCQRLAIDKGFQPNIIMHLIARGYFLFDMEDTLKGNTFLYQPNQLLSRGAA
ncbi:TnsA endonuclease N-terminal domain-containing protein [Salinimonas iocasae]|uniref:TnsA endonuclease N-terminal domain-containing protein n=1 Tax=Salinimonas iocasae TaxID=2572577 RepID=A0A5B7YGA8_9ALTE|nr:TnsA endonuclease N-terminal domain-containing protein [Salinimonas iocasae]QCZ94380.1 hypothetical protein FBQ74_13280 [Salinimonas iocasae]